MYLKRPIFQETWLMEELFNFIMLLEPLKYKLINIPHKKFLFTITRYSLHCRLILVP